MQFLFNTNHEQPSILVWILLIVIAVVIPNYVRYRMEQKHSNGSVPPRTCPFSPRRKNEAQQEALNHRLRSYGMELRLCHNKMSRFHSPMSLRLPPL